MFNQLSKPPGRKRFFLFVVIAYLLVAGGFLWFAPHSQIPIVEAYSETATLVELNTSLPVTIKAVKSSIAKNVGPSNSGPTQNIAPNPARQKFDNSGLLVPKGVSAAKVNFYLPYRKTPSTSTGFSPIIGGGGNQVDSNVPTKVVPDGEPPEPPKPKVILSVPIKVSEGVLVGKALSIPKPPYPNLAKLSHIQGSVVVHVVLSEEGSVVSANIVSGHPMLTQIALQYAKQTRFSVTTLSGQPIKIEGNIRYNFQLQ